MLVRCHACHGSWSLYSNFDSPPNALTIILVSYTRREIRDEGWEWEGVGEI